MKAAYKLASHIVRRNKSARSVTALAKLVPAGKWLPGGVLKKNVVEQFAIILPLRARSDPPSLQARLCAYLVDLTGQAIFERSLSTPAGYNLFAGRVVCKGKSMWIVNYSGFFKYSSRFGTRFQSANYLTGREDGQLWAVRIPSTVTTLAEAERWLMPSDVKKAFDAGAEVLRQGDFYFIRKRIKYHDLSACTGTRHAVQLDKTGIKITHPEHKALVLDTTGKGCWRAYQQQQLDNNKG